MPIDDNFDSYTDGDLNGQGGWSGSTNYDIQGDVFQSSPKAVRQTAAAGGEVFKTGNMATSGFQTIYGRCANVATPNDLWNVELREEGVASYIFVRVRASVCVYFNGSIYVPIIGALANDTWFKLDIEWAADSTARYRVDDGTWTSFATFNGTMSDGINSISCYKDVANATAAYWDTLSNGNTPAGSTAKNLTLLGTGT